MLASDAGPLFNVSVEESAKILRIEPGAKDLKNASPLQLQDLQVGDRILVLGKVSDDGHSVAATSVIAMKKADVIVESKSTIARNGRGDGVGGLVSAVDPAAGTITISTQSLAGAKSVVIRVPKDTIVRRYAADSVKFDDAKPSSLDRNQAGRSSSGPRRTQFGRRRMGGGRSRFRRISKHCRLSRFGGSIDEHAQRHRFD